MSQRVMGFTGGREPRTVTASEIQSERGPLIELSDGAAAIAISHETLESILRWAREPRDGAR